MLFLTQLVFQSVVAMALAGTPSIRSEEFVPPSNRGPAVVVVSGAFGLGAYRSQARRIAALGYDVLLIDGRDLVGEEEAGLTATILRARSSVHASPGKIGLMGFSLGGGQLLAFAPSRSEEVGVIIVMYPVTSTLGDRFAVAAATRVPVLLLAGESDTFKACCTVERARALADAARANRAPLTLITYSHVGHDFVVEGTDGFNRRAARDAWSRSARWLAHYLG